MTTRRAFIIHTALAASALASSPAMAAAPSPAGNSLLETDPQAAALGYLADTAKVDDKKFPKHAKDQVCSNCVLYQGKASEASGGCPIYAGKAVAAKGWCSAYAKKA